MIVAVIMFFLGKAFFDLAVSYGKSEWSYAALAIFIYCSTTAAVSAGIGILILLWELYGVSRFAISLLGLSIGVVLCMLLYTILKKRWDLEIANELANPDIGLV